MPAADGSGLKLLQMGIQPTCLQPDELAIQAVTSNLTQLP